MDRIRLGGNIYNLSDNNTIVVAEDVTSAVWMATQDGERIAYGKIVSPEEKRSAFDIWIVRPDGSDTTKLHTFSFDEENYMWIYDSYESNLLMESSESRGSRLLKTRFSSST